MPDQMSSSLAGSNEPGSGSAASDGASPTTDVKMIDAKWLSILGLRLIIDAMNNPFLSSGSVPRPLSAAYYAVLFTLIIVDLAVLVTVKAQGPRPALTKVAKRAALVVVVSVELLTVATKIFGVLFN